MKSTNLEEGTYYIGDPGYVIPLDMWDEFIATYEGLRDCEVKEFGGYQMYANHTHCGDGSYRDSLCNSYCVDAGLLSIIPMELVEKYGELDNISFESGHGYYIHTFEKPFEVKWRNGDFLFGHISLCTEDEESPTYQALLFNDAQLN